MENEFLQRAEKAVGESAHYEDIINDVAVAIAQAVLDGCISRQLADKAHEFIVEMNQK